MTTFDKRIAAIAALVLMVTLNQGVLYAQSRTASQPQPQPQTAKSNANTKPRKGEPTATLSAAWAPVQLDHYLGVRGGYGIGNTRQEPVRQTQSMMGLIVLGVSYKFDVPSQKYVGAIEADINFSQKGYIIHPYYDSEDVKSRKYNTIEIPILWQPYLPLGKSGSRFYLSLGPHFSYAFNSTFRDYNTTTGKTDQEGKYEYETGRDNRFEYGITFGGGFLIAARKFRISLEYRYNISLSDTFKSVTKYPENPFRSPVDQMNISLGLSYKIHSGMTNRQKNNNLHTK